MGRTLRLPLLTAMLCIAAVRADDLETPPRPPRVARAERLAEPSGFDLDAMGSVIGVYEVRRSLGESEGEAVRHLASEFMAYSRRKRCTDCGARISKTVCGVCKACTIKAMSPAD